MGLKTGGKILFVPQAVPLKEVVMIVQHMRSIVYHVHLSGRLHYPTVTPQFDGTSQTNAVSDSVRFLRVKWIIAPFMGSRGCTY